MPLSGLAVAEIGIGGILVYSGIKGYSIADTFTSLAKGTTPAQTEPIAAASSGTGSSAVAPGTASANGINAVPGSTTQNGTSIYKFLRGNGYNPMAAAGAIASMYGESAWDPESIGDDGCGLMGWTPESTITSYGGTCHAAGIGNNSTQQDFNSQLGAILSYVAKNGGGSAVSMMSGATSIDQSAEIWGQHVERYGIDDVHPEGIALAASIAQSVDGVSLAAG
jgi:hypothetical protein